MAHGLHTLSPRSGATSARKRVGRGPGSGLGKTSGRGNKGQKSRSGYRSNRGNEGGQMPLHRRVPKRGFTNLFRKDYNIVTLASLERFFSSGARVDQATLKAAGVKLKEGVPIKILASGEVRKALTVSVHHVSAGAKKKIEAAGGRVEEIKA